MRPLKLITLIISTSLLSCITGNQLQNKTINVEKRDTNNSINIPYFEILQPVTDCYIDTILKLLSGNSSKIRAILHCFDIDRDYSTTKHLHIYDTNNHLIRSLKTFKDSNIYNYRMYTDYLYDHKGRKESVTNYFRESNGGSYTKGEMRYYYNNKGLDYVTQSLYYKDKPTDFKELKCIIDSLGNILLDYESEWLPTSYSYDSLGRIISYMGYEIDLEYIYKDGIIYQEISEHGGKEITTLNKKGLKVSHEYYNDSDDKELIHTDYFTYEYDNRGNWIKMFVVQDDTTRLSEWRDITYY
ncbi:MAG: hypothetical protein ACRDDZ_00205 [Marinifilaceae bacterium]